MFEEIAAGGMAAVHLGRLRSEGGFSRTVAVKRLHPQFARDPDFVTMFLDEARLASRVRHPNVVATLDVVTESEDVLLVMEYVVGEALSRLMRAVKPGTLPLPVSIAIMTAVLHGLHAAHQATTEQGTALEIVHRDVSPQNILVGVDGVARVLDFGVAKAAHRAQTTKEGQLKGKLSYMPPEQLRRDAIDRRSDVYAASVVLWELITGERLFDAESEAKVVMNVLTLDVPTPSERVNGLPPALDAVVRKGLARDPAERFQTAREMAVALERCGIPLAPSSQIGECVEALAAASLAQRATRVTEIERLSDQALASSATLRAALQSAATLPQPIEPDPIVSSAGYNATATIPGRESKSGRMLLVGLGLLVMLGVLGFVVTKNNEQAPPAAAIASPPPPVASSPAPIPEAASTSEPTVAAAPSAAPSASATSVTSAAAPAVSVTAPKKLVVAAPPAPPKADKCKPPYTIDANGIRHLKPECL
ncbi:MAG: serine/threonine protein kinase [Labilithrix sp.]|nr:serine/threonine protein kinase [Labilithrix sp.]